MNLHRFTLCCLLLTTCLLAQETQLGSDFRREGEQLRDGCSSIKSLFGCASTLATDHPLHLTAGSLAPQNGMGLGGAFVAAKNTTNWRHTWNVDGVASTSGAWRAGGYMTSAWVRRRQIVARPGGGATSNLAVSEYPVFQLYGEHTSLNNVSFYGLGPNSVQADRRVFQFAETISGLRTVFPLSHVLNLSVEGEANGRFVNTRPAINSTAPALPTLSNDAYAQFGQGVRIRPSFIGGHLGLNYSGRYQQFIGTSNNSFQRLTLDFNHTVPLYNSSRPAADPSQGPDDCTSAAVSGRTCPAHPVSRNLNGSVNFRVLMTESYTQGNNGVPFYFQPTLGGSDINGTPMLPSFADYRFRAPNIFLARASFEHSIWGPLGFTAMADWGKASFNRFDTSNLRHSFSTGLTLRAGSVPLVYLLFSFGGGEGNHTSARMDTSLLGSGGRPSLY